jgi:circadian clock protein KaiC
MGQQGGSVVSFLSSGIPGLDEILRGGFIRDRLYLIEGEPGSGKTTLALQFLLEGVRQGEPVLYITLSESRTEIEEVAASHGWTMDGIHVHEVLPPESILTPEEQYTIFHPSDVETAAATQDILAVIETVQPTRVVLDSLSELQLLAASLLVYRRQILALRQFFTRRSCTALLLNDRSEVDGGLHTRSIAHGVVRLDRISTDYGGFRRRVEVIKYRGVAFREGMHDYRIRHGGLVVYPRLVAAESREQIGRAHLRSGLDELDLLLGGGIEEGTSTLIVGPAGCGKSTLAAQFAISAMRAGKPAAIFLFEESTSTFLHRADGLGFDFRTPLAAGLARLVQIDPAQITPGEFAHDVCRLVEHGTKIIVLDSLNGFVHSMPSEKQLASHLHELLTYLAQRGVNTFLVAVQHGLLAETYEAEISSSYIADNVILLRYFEALGEVRQAISVFKKRIGSHERTIRQMAITSSGIQIGPILRQFRGVLTGVPEWIAAPDQERDTHG